MPWMPEVFSAPIAEAIRHREAESANDAVAYYEGIMADQPEALVRSFAGEPVLDDPRVGLVQGTRPLRAFVNGTADWLRERDAVVENVALARTQARTVEEVVLHLLSEGGERVELPVTVVADRNPDRTVKARRATPWATAPSTSPSATRSSRATRWSPTTPTPTPAAPGSSPGGPRRTASGRWTPSTSWRRRAPGRSCPATASPGRAEQRAPWEKPGGWESSRLRLMCSLIYAANCG